MNTSSAATVNNAPPSLPIRIAGLTKHYRVGFTRTRTVKALQSLDLAVEPGQVYGLLGPNGAGKSTTIKILMGLVWATEGTAQLFGRPLSNVEIRRRVGYVPENPNPYEYLTSREFLHLAGAMVGLSGKELHDRTREVLSLVELDKVQTLQIRRYSKGMVQRVALAQALMGRPELLVLDEPTSGLDPLGRRKIRDLILSERERGTTILYCTHIIPDIESLCDRVAVLVGGRRVREGSVSTLLSSDADVVELVVENLSEESLLASTSDIALESVKTLEERLLVRVTDESSQRLLTTIINAGGRVNRMQPVRFTLEELFLSTIEQSGRERTVGGDYT